MSLKNSRILVAVVVFLGLVGAVIALVPKAQKSDQASMTVTASYYPLYDIAKSVGGNKVAVTNITPAGSEPHDYEPTPRQLIDAQKSNVLIYNGASMEPWVQKFLPDYKHQVVKASTGIDLIRTSENYEGRKTHVADPHFWLDPVLAEKMVDTIVDGLSKASPADRQYFTARANAYKMRLAQLDTAYATGLKTCQLRTVVSSHDAFSYLAKRYNLEVVSIAGISPEDEPSAAKLAELSKLVKEKQVPYVFFESLVSPKLAQTLATETGAKTAVFDPIEGISNDDQKEGKDYFSVQRENLAALRRALACQ